MREIAQAGFAVREPRETAPLLRHVARQRDAAAVRRRPRDAFERAPVGQLQRDDGARRPVSGEARAHESLAQAVVPVPDRIARQRLDDLFEGHADGDVPVGVAERADIARVPRDEAAVRVVEGEPLVERVEPLAEPAFGGVGRRARGVLGSRVARHRHDAAVARRRFQNLVVAPVGKAPVDAPPEPFAPPGALVEKSGSLVRVEAVARPGGRVRDDVREGRARLQQSGRNVEHFAIAPVVRDEPVLRVVEREAVRHALDRVGKKRRRGRRSPISGRGSFGLAVGLCFGHRPLQYPLCRGNG